MSDPKSIDAEHPRRDEADAIDDQDLDQVAGGLNPPIGGVIGESGSDIKKERIEIHS